jgi:hypothetical protein
MITATAALPVKAGQGFVATPTEGKGAMWDLIPTPQYILLEEGEFVLRGYHGQLRIARLTGRTRRMSASWVAATATTFDVDTVVRDLPDGTPALWGVRGEGFGGTWAINQKALV